jgi:hypothetical protein
MNCDHLSLIKSRLIFRKAGLLFLSIFIFSTVFANDLKYPVAEIPEALIKKNYAVIREDINEFRIQGINRSSLYVKEVITILNPRGNFLARKAMPYDPGSRLQIITASIYAADGHLIRKIKNSEIEDQSAYDGSLYSDNRLRKLDLSQNFFPYTIVCEYEYSYRTLFGVPPFTLYNDDEVGIQEKTFSVYYPQNLKLRYRLIKAPEPQRSRVDAFEKLSWSFKNVQPEPWEKFSDPASSVPTILVAPLEFEYAGYAGTMDTWENLGKWQSSLNKGRGALSEETRAKVGQLTSGKSDADKVKALYEFMQSKTRYVSIQLGIGGLQPFEARVVDQVGYGDCKALSNYMIALLGEAGIKGYYTWVNGGTGREPLPDFPTNFGNHIIVSVPMPGDTIWLECTSQTQPFNFLGTFTANRYALMITDEGGKLVRTPAYNKNINQQLTSGNIAIDNSGQATANASLMFKGLKYDEGGVGYYSKLGADKQKEWAEHSIDIPSFNLLSLSMKTQAGAIPAAKIDCSLHLPNCATSQGKRLFLQPNLLTKLKSVPEKLENRKGDIVLDIAYSEVDSLVYTFHDDLYVEFLPSAVNLTSRFGDYQVRYLFEGGKLIYVRKLSMNNGLFAKETYPEFVEFFKGINKADFTKIVLVNKT